MFKKTYRFNTLQPEKMKTKIWLLIFAFLGGKFAYFEIMEFQIFENFALETIRCKKKLPSCSLCSQFTASQKLPLLFPNARMKPSTETIDARSRKQ